MGWDFGHMKVYSCEWQGLVLLALALCRGGCNPLSSWHVVRFYLYFNLKTKHFMDSPAMKHSYGATLCTPGCGHLLLNMYIVIVIVYAEDFYGTGLGLILNFYFSQIYITIFFNRVLVIAPVLPFGHPLYVAQLEAPN